MVEYRDQVEGDLTPGRGFDVVQILHERKTKTTLATLRSGETVAIKNASSGRDIGSEWEHLYFDADGESYFLNAADIAALTDPETRTVLYRST